MKGNAFLMAGLGIIALMLVAGMLVVFFPAEFIKFFIMQHWILIPLSITLVSVGFMGFDPLKIVGIFVLVILIWNVGLVQYI